MALELKSLEKAIKSFEQSILKTTDKEFIKELDEITYKLLKSGVIQNFEFTYELCWKFLKRWLSENIGKSYVEGITRRHLFRYGAENKLIDDVDKWMIFHRARNLTSHTYDEDIAEEVFEIAIEFLSEAKNLLKSIEVRND